MLLQKGTSGGEMVSKLDVQTFKRVSSSLIGCPIHTALCDI